nr:MAG TPA_asm: Sigma-70, region 4 [Caudoviricetes sp.]
MAPRSDRHRTVVEDIMWLHGECGESMEQVARQLGYSSAANLATALDHWGDKSMARRVRFYAAPRDGVWAA